MPLTKAWPKAEASRVPSHSQIPFATLPGICRILGVPLGIATMAFLGASVGAGNDEIFSPKHPALLLAALYKKYFPGVVAALSQTLWENVPFIGKVTTNVALSMACFAGAYSPIAVIGVEQWPRFLSTMFYTYGMSARNLLYQGPTFLASVVALAGVASSTIVGLGESILAGLASSQLALVAACIMVVNLPAILNQVLPPLRQYFLETFSSPSKAWRFVLQNAGFSQGYSMGYETHGPLGGLVGGLAGLASGEILSRFTQVIFNLIFCPARYCGPKIPSVSSHADYSSLPGEPTAAVSAAGLGHKKNVGESSVNPVKAEGKEVVLSRSEQVKAVKALCRLVQEMSECAASPDASTAQTLNCLQLFLGGLCDRFGCAPRGYVKQLERDKNHDEKMTLDGEEDTPNASGVTDSYTGVGGWVQYLAEGTATMLGRVVNAGDTRGVERHKAALRVKVKSHIEKQEAGDGFSTAEAARLGLAKTLIGNNSGVVAVGYYAAALVEGLGFPTTRVAKYEAAAAYCTKHAPVS